MSRDSLAVSSPDEQGQALSRLLVVDDSAAVRDLCARMLSVRGHEVVLAADATQAIALYKERRPDAVLLDMHMPGIDGLAVLEAIREHDPTARVAMLTSDPDETIVRRAFALGARDYVLKPFYGERLDTAVARLLPPHSPAAD